MTKDVLGFEHFHMENVDIEQLDKADLDGDGKVRLTNPLMMIQKVLLQLLGGQQALV